jgi:ribonuclease BN (tRNA processing enzyme)
VFGDFMRPPYFPVHFSDLQGEVQFHDTYEDDLAVGNAKVRVRPVPHCGPTVGYRVEWDGAVVAYVSDHQAPLSLDTVADSVLELCDGADLLIHDAQYTPTEFGAKADWGHCTVDYALLVAREAGAKALALFHHDPAHDDDMVDRLLAGAQTASARVDGPRVLAAAEGLTLDL